MTLTTPLSAFVRDVPDFPKAGILFRDITPLLSHAEAFSEAVAAMAQPVLTLQPTHVLGLESRGFIFGSALAQKLGVGFVPARKPGKLPMATHKEAYGLEYGSDALEIHTDAFGPGDRVLIVDDVMATGGTAAAAQRLVQKTGAQPVALTVFIELTSLPGREKVEGLPVFSVLRYWSVFRIPASRDGGQPRDPARKRAQGDAGHRPSAVTPLGARLDTVPPGWGGGRRLASSRALDMEPPCLRALS